MRRRKQRNPLLKWILIATVLLHIILLPILAKFGALKRAQQLYTVGEVKVVNLPPPAPVKPPEVKKEAKAKPPKPNPAAKLAKATTPHQRQAATRSNLSQPKVAVASGASGGDTGGGVVDPGTGKAGELPTEKTDTTTPTIKAPDPRPDPMPIVKAEPKPDPAPIAKAEPKPEPKPEPRPAPQPKPEPAPAPHVPVYTEAAQTYAPQPSIPDDLRAAALDTTVVVEIVVDENGSATAVKLTKPTGNDELDRIALDTARKWKFKPALRDGQPVESRVRLHIEFQVS